MTTSISTPTATSATSADALAATATADGLWTAKSVAELAAQSHRVIVQHQHSSGAYPASPTFLAYRGYSWLRDGGFIAEGVSRYGDVDSADRFHDWVSHTIGRRREAVQLLVDRAKRGEAIPTSDMLPTRFTLEGDTGRDPWWDFQTDGYATWLWSALTHADRHGLDPRRWQTAIDTTVDYLSTFWDLACYDWWEEHVEHRHVSTLGAIYGGLTSATRSGLLTPERTDRAAAAADASRTLILREGQADGHLTKWLGSSEIDGSLPACIAPFDVIPPGSPLATATVQAVMRDLDVDGGVHRFRADVFFGGGQWPILSAFLGWNLAAGGDHEGARRHLDWISAQFTATGDLPEQTDGHLLHPDHRQEWLDRWGPVATPLLWSHGMYLVLADVLDLLPSDR